MNDATMQFIVELKTDIARWEKMAAFLEDPHTAKCRANRAEVLRQFAVGSARAIEDMQGKLQDKGAMAARYWALAAEYRELLSKLSG